MKNAPRKQALTLNPETAQDPRPNARLLDILCGVAAVLRPLLKGDTEVVVHDLLNLKSSAVSVVNGHVSGRRPGYSIITAPGKTAHFEEMMARVGKPDDIWVSEPYRSEVEGRTLESCSVVYHDADGQAVAALCVNVDLSMGEQLQNIVRSMFQANAGPPDDDLESRETNLGDLVEQIIEDALAAAGATPERMTTAERMDAVSTMYDRGLFQIRGSVELVAGRMKTSKFTIYSYLDRLGLKRPTVKGA